jgi:hypothetical protein
LSLNLLLFIEVVDLFSVASTVIMRLSLIEVVASSEPLAAIVAVQESEGQLVLFFVLEILIDGKDVARL